MLFLILISIITGAYIEREYIAPRNTIGITTIPGDTDSTITYIPKPYPVFKDTGSSHWYPVYRDTGSTRWKFYDVDTAAILKDYRYILVYNRILKDDSSLFIGLVDTVSENRLWGSKLSVINRRPISIIDSMHGRVPVNYEPIGLYAGFSVGRSTRQFGIGPSIMLLRKNTSYSIVYDLTNKDLYFNISAPIWKPRKVP